MKKAFQRLLAAGTGLLLAVTLASCGGGSGGNLSSGGSGGGGGGGGGTTGSNVATVSVDPGATTNSLNMLFVSVTICLPGSSTCQTIPNIQVDTGSYGLRILSSALTLALPTQPAQIGGALTECSAFVDGFVWGPVVLADVKISGETVSSMPMQVMGDSRYPTPPDACNGFGSEEDTLATFGANGILGVGPLQYDCGTDCRDNAFTMGYYGCTTSAATSCTATMASLAEQVQSVVARFAVNNNGVIIELPAVSNPGAGAATLSGTLTFGIDTQTNNASGAQTVLTTDASGDITIAYNGQQLNQSFIDSGTNGTYFNDASIPLCTQTELNGLGFYCPTSTLNLSATLRGLNNNTSIISFSIGNTYNMLRANNSFAVFPQLGGQYPGNTPTFDFGLPFFYGRRVAVAFTGATTQVGTGPYFAF